MIIGIDLGTTNCACAIFRDGEVVMVPNSLGHVLTPSAVSLDEKDNILTGLAARERQSSHGERTATAFKRLMGTRTDTVLGRLRFSPEELSALMLRSLKADAEAFLGEPVEEAVVTVPAYFNDKQRKATRRAGELAGLKVERLINEPTAAALAYGLHLRDKETRFLVFDLGGGTFDVSILELFDGVIEVRATSGDNRLGGEDFNDIVVQLAKRRLGESLPSNNANAVHLGRKLREAAERTRRALSANQQAELSFAWNGKDVRCVISTEEFEAACEPLLDRLREPVLRSMRDSNISLANLDEILLIGGATRMPIVRKAVTRMFGRFPSSAIDPDEAVARGAAIQAALKMRNADLKDVVLTDVCPFTLGVNAAERRGAAIVQNVFVPILERNCVVPASREKSFGTMGANQSAVEFDIYQGESRWANENVHLGNIRVAVPPGRPGEHEIRCRFSYDINGLLEVDVHVPETGARQQLVIMDREGVSPDEVARRREQLAKLKVHPRETDANRATLARAGRCYENHTGPMRETIGVWISEFEFILERQDPIECERARKALETALDGVDGQTFL